jgi:hypothetical protein
LYSKDSVDLFTGPEDKITEKIKGGDRVKIVIKPLNVNQLGKRALLFYSWHLLKGPMAAFALVSSFSFLHGWWCACMYLGWQVDDDR